MVLIDFPPRLDYDGSRGPFCAVKDALLAVGQGPDKGSCNLCGNGVWRGLVGKTEVATGLVKDDGTARRRLKTA